MRITADHHDVDVVDLFELAVDKTDPRLGMPERALQEAIIELAGHLGYRHYHTHDARRSPQGFPDLLLVHPGRRRTLYAELKSTKGRLTTTQLDWLVDLAVAGNHVHLWRPYDWITGAIERELRGPRI